MKKLLALITLLIVPTLALADYQFEPGATSQTIEIVVDDSSSATGARLTGLAYNTASLTCYYHRQGAATAVAITLANATVGTWTSSGFVAVDGTNMPGHYELGIPNAALVPGAKYLTIECKGAANMVPVSVRIPFKSTPRRD